MSSTISQLPRLAPSAADLLPVYHLATGDTIGASIAQIQALAQANVQPISFPYDAAVLSEASLRHYYKMNEAAGVTTLADSKGSTPLTLVSNVNPASAGAASIIMDLESCVRIAAPPSSGTYSYITVPASLFAGLTSFSVEMLWCDIWATSNVVPVGQPVFISTYDAVGATPGGFEITTHNSGSDAFQSPFWIGTSSLHQNSTSFTGPDFAHIVLTVGAGVANLYVNGYLVCTGSTASLGIGVPVVDGRIGCRTDNTWPNQGRVAKFAVYGSVLQQNQIENHLNYAH